MWGLTWPQAFVVLVMFVFAGWALYLLAVDAGNDRIREQVEEDVINHVIDVLDAYANEQTNPALRVLAADLADRLEQELTDHGS